VCTRFWLHFAPIAFGKTAGASDRQRFRLANTDRKEGNGVAGLMSGNPAAHISRPFGLAAAHGVEQILRREHAACSACCTPRDSDPALDVGTGVPARGECCGTKVGADKIRAEMHLENADQSRHIGKRDSDMMVQATGADEGAVKL
jgi:hypothetical protein